MFYILTWYLKNNLCWYLFIYSLVFSNIFPDKIYIFSNVFLAIKLDVLHLFMIVLWDKLYWDTFGFEYGLPNRSSLFEFIIVIALHSYTSKKKGENYSYCIIFALKVCLYCKTKSFNRNRRKEKTYYAWYLASWKKPFISGWPIISAKLNSEF